MTWVQGDKRDPEKLRMEREELERQQREGLKSLLLNLTTGHNNTR